jgi:uncharacterized transporter YbjL
VDRRGSGVCDGVLVGVVAMNTALAFALGSFAGIAFSALLLLIFGEHHDNAESLADIATKPVTRDKANRSH